MLRCSLAVLFFVASIASSSCAGGGSPEANPTPGPSPTETPNLDQEPVLSFDLYAATHAGLAIQRYENAALVSSTPIANWNVSSLKVLNDVLYVGTDSGLYFAPIQSQNWAYRSPADGLVSYSIEDVAAHEGDFWVAGPGGLSRSVDQGLSFDEVGAASGLKGNQAAVIESFGAGAILVGTDAGLYLSTDSGTSFVRKRNIYVFDLVTRGTFESGTGTIFAASLQGISRSLDSGLTFNEISFDSHIKMTRDLEWIEGSGALAAVVGYENSDSDLLFLCLTPLALDPQCQDITASAQIFGESISSIDSEGSRLYVGTNSGLIRLELTAFPTISSQKFSESDGLPSRFTTEVLSLSPSQIFVGTNAGLAKWNAATSRFDEWSPTRRLGSNTVYASELLSDGTLWIGTSRGLTRLEADGTFVRPEGVMNENIHHIAHSPSNEIFLSTSNGIFKSSDRGVSWVQYTTSHGLGMNWTNHVAVTSSGDLYAANGAGLYRLKSGSSQFESLLPEKIWDVRVMSDGKILVATESGFKLSSDAGLSFQTVTRSNDYSSSYVSLGLGDNIVYSLFDLGGRIFAGTNGGLSLSDDGGVNFVNRHRDHGLSTPNSYSVSALGGTVAVATSRGVALSLDNAQSFVVVPTPSHQANRVLLH